MQKNSALKLQSYIRDMEEEIIEWERFTEDLKEEDSKAFSQLVEVCRRYILPGSKANRQHPLEIMIMSILLHHEKKLEYIKETLDDLIAEVPRNKKTQSVKDIKTENIQSQYLKKPSVLKKNRELALVKQKLKNYIQFLDFKDSRYSIILTPKMFFGKEKFAKIAQIIKSLDGSYISDGRNSHFKIPKQSR